MSKNTLKFTKEELDSEQWKLINWSNGTYYVSNLGRVKKQYKHSSYVLTPYFKNSSKKSSNKRTLFVKIFTDNNTKENSNKRNFKQVMVHQLVAEYFLRMKPSEKHVLYHMNGVITDNRAFNLKWVTKKELGKLTGGKTKKVRGIVKVDPDTREVIDFYKTSRQAAKENYCSYQTILDSCNGKYKRNCTGFLFRWADTVRNKMAWE